MIYCVKISLPNQVAQSLLGLQPMPARSVNDFFVGIFYAQRKVGFGVKMTMKGESTSRKSDIKIVKIEEVRDKEQEMTVRRERASRKKEASIWSWHEEFAVAWSESFITKKRNPRKGE